MKAFVFASGEAKRWTETRPGPELPEHKQLLEVDDVPIIVRTCAQLRERNCSVVVVTPHSPIVDALHHMDVEFLDVGMPHLWVDTLERTAPEWAEGMNVALLGDVFFSHSAMDRICAAKSRMLYGRPFPSVITGNRAPGEPFAWAWNMPEDEKKMRTAINLAIADADSKPGERDQAGTPLGSMWQLYRGCVGEPLEQRHFICRQAFTTINDFTDDFDTLEGYLLWLKRYARRMVKQPRIDLEARR